MVNEPPVQPLPTLTPIAHARRRRTGWLGPLQVLLTIVQVLNLIFLPLTAIGLPIAMAMGVLPLYVEVVATEPIDTEAIVGAVPGLSPGAKVSPYGTIDIEVASPSALQIGLFVSVILINSIFFAVLVELLRRTVRRARRDTPFSMIIVRRLRQLGFATMIGGVVITAYSWIADFAVSATVSLDGATFSESGSGGMGFGTAIFGGFVFLAVAEVINHGLALQTELAEVV